MTNTVRSGIYIRKNSHVRCNYFHLFTDLIKSMTTFSRSFFSFIIYNNAIKMVVSQISINMTLSNHLQLAVNIFLKTTYSVKACLITYF